MKKNILLLSYFFLFNIATLFASEIRIKEPFGMANQFDLNTMVSKGNKIAIFGKNFENNENFGYRAFFIFNGEKWEAIPQIYVNQQGKVDTLSEVTAGAPYYVTPSFDKEGTFWFPGRFGFYQYKNNQIVKYSLPDPDSISDNYYYSHLRFDSLGNILLMRTKILKKVPLGANGKGPYNVESIWQLVTFNPITKEYKILANGNGYETDYIGNLLVLKNGEIVFFKADSSLAKKTLYIFSKDFQLLGTYKIPTPPFLKDSLRYLNAGASPGIIFEDEQRNIWIGLSMSGRVGGLLKLNRKTGQWKAFYGADGYPVAEHPIGGSRYTDSLYFECNAIAQDQSGRIWVGGRYFLGIIDENEKIVPPDFILENLTLYPRIISNEKQKPTYESFLADSLIDFVYKLNHKLFLPYYYFSEIGMPTVSGISTTEDGSIWIAVNGLGILQYRPLKSNVDDFRANKDFVLINPQILSRGDKQFTIKFNEVVDRFSLCMYDLGGRRVFNADYVTKTGSSEFSIDLNEANLSAGTYFIAINLGEKIYLKKIIVN